MKETSLFTLMLSPSERQELQQLATIERRTLASAMRVAVSEALERRLLRQGGLDRLNHDEWQPSEIMMS